MNEHDDAKRELERFFNVQKPPIAELLGWELVDLDPDRGWISVAFTATDQFRNPAGNVHGGILAAMLDDTMGPAVLVASHGKFYSPTINMNVSFARAAKPGRLIGEATVVQMGRTVAFVDGRLTNDAGELLAFANCSVRLVPVETLQR